MKKMNNKGFSLVELIIVIAIMAILIVVLAPQYLRYVERSRNSTDMQNVTQLTEAIQIYAADPQATPAITTASNNATITITATGGAIVDGDTNGPINEALDQTGLQVGTIRCSSRTAWASYRIIVHVEADGNVSFEYESYPNNDGTGGDNGTLETRMQGN